MGLHVLLIGILLFGAAFLASEPKDESRPVLTAFDPTMVNDLLTKGGNPNVQVAPPTSVPQAAPPQIKPVETPKPVEPPRPKQVVHEKVETPEPVAKNKISDDEPKPKKRESLSSDELKLTKPRVSKPVKNRDRDQSDSKAKEYADARRAAQNFERSVRNLSKELSTSTAVELPGPGGGGPLSAAYRDIVASTYDGAWSSPADLNDENAKVSITVTIARNGRVINGHISRPSHNAAMDRSVQNLLDTVTFIAPFPEGSSDSERTFEIILTVRAKH